MRWNEAEILFLERRIAEEGVRAMVAQCSSSRDAHLGLLRLYRQRLEIARLSALPKGVTPQAASSFAAA
jgi:hypothetical protein